MKKLLLSGLVLLTSQISLAGTSGLEGLKKFDCTVVSESGIIEQANPIAKTLLAESKAQATAMYLMSLSSSGVSQGNIIVGRANMVGDTVSLTVADHRSQDVNQGYVSDNLTAVNCTEI